MKQNNANIFTIQPVIPTDNAALKDNVITVEEWSETPQECNAPDVQKNIETRNATKNQDCLNIEKVNYWNGLYGVVVVIACILSSFIVILIPQHNVIELPEYWYEGMFIGIFGFWFNLVTSTILECKIVLNYPDKTSFIVMIDLFVTVSISLLITYSFMYTS